MSVILLFISGAEIFVVLLIALLLFGANKIPEIARGLGKGLNEFKKATNEIKREINDSTGGIGKDLKDIKRTFDETKRDIKNSTKPDDDDAKNDKSDDKKDDTKK